MTAWREHSTLIQLCQLQDSMQMYEFKVQSIILVFLQDQLIPTIFLQSFTGRKIGPED